MLAWVVQDWVGHTDLELLSHDEGEVLTAIKQQVLRSGVGTTETTVTFQGETHHFDLTMEPLRDYNGDCAGLTSPPLISLN